jgi:dethiobiotin synthetase
MTESPFDDVPLADASSPPPSSDVFVVGTDTGVGKTLVASALLHVLARRHARVCGMKPVASGAVLAAGGWVSEDAVALRAASTIEVPAALDNPVLLHEPIAPLFAARRAQVEIDVDLLARAYRRLRARADAVVVEGAGGFLVPLGERTTGADLAVALGLPIVLVVGLRLGALNHALLTAEAIRARGLVLAGWVANRIDPAFGFVDENIAYLSRHLGAPCWADLPHQARADARVAAALVDESRMAASLSARRDR